MIPLVNCPHQGRLIDVLSHLRSGSPQQSRAPGRGGLSPRLRLSGPTFDRSCIGGVARDCQCWELARSEPGLCWHPPKGTERCHVDFLGSGEAAGATVMCEPHHCPLFTSRPVTHPQGEKKTQASSGERADVRE